MCPFRSKPARAKSLIGPVLSLSLLSAPIEIARLGPSDDDATRIVQGATA